jgi:alpha-ketoglutarate-dependent taurine dioxygenase
MLKTKPLHHVGVEIFDFDLTTATQSQYAEIKEIFLSELIVVFKNQKNLTLPFAKLVASVGQIANFSQCAWNSYGDRTEIQSFLNPFDWTQDDREFPVQRVTGMKKNDVDTGIFGQGVLDWHSNMNGPFNRARGVALQGVEGVTGTSTLWMDTTRAYEEMSPDLKKRCEGVVGRYVYSPEVWAEGLPAWQYEGMLRNKEEFYEMPLLNKSFKGKTGLYFHFLNSCSFPTDPGLLEVLKTHCFQDRYIQDMQWEPGDIHLSDQVLTLHKRVQNDPQILSKRVLHRYTFNFDAN